VALNTQRLIIQGLNEKLQTGANELGESKLLVISLNENMLKLNDQKSLLESKLTTINDELAEKKRYAESLRQELKAMESRQKLFDVFNVVERRSQGIIYINGNKLPISFTFIDQSHSPQDFYLLYLPYVTDNFANFDHVNGIIVTQLLSVWMLLSRVLPCLG
jgi:hypothetical protein